MAYSKFRLFFKPLTKELSKLFFGSYHRSRLLLKSVFFPMKNPKHIRFKHILIVTYGRSGSTLLQGMLNSIPGVLVKGENENIFYDFYGIYKKLLSMKRQFKDAVLPSHPWYGISDFSEKSVIENFQAFASHLLLSGVHEPEKYHCTGFKEIRYPSTEDNLEGYLKFLNLLFPEAAFIFNTRNLNDVSNSAWWKTTSKEALITYLSTFEGRMMNFVKNNPNCFHIRYDEVVENGVKLRALFDFLGAEYDATQCEKVLNKLHSYAPSQKQISEKFNRK